MPAVLVGNMMTSTPTLQAPLMEAPSADKKRNKLGYHRTSVACVHCRRRKIRCLVAADDAQGRCENCIRLRKECQFFPVDQQPPVERKSRPNSRLESASTDPSTTSSSPPPLGGGPDHGESYYSYQPMPMAGQDAAGYPTTTFPGHPMSGFVPGSTDFATAPLDPSVPWDEFTTISDQQMLNNMAVGKPPMMNMSGHVWNSGPNAMAPMPPTPGMPATPTVPSQSQPISPVQTYAVQPDGSVWPVAPLPRSMTFPTQPDMAAYPNPSQFNQQVHPDLKRRMTSPAQGFPATQMNPQSPPPADLQGTTVSMSYPGQPATMGYPGWQDMNGLSTMNVVQYPMFPGGPTQQAAFGTPPAHMGHPGQGPPPAS
ncbi:putative C6 finger domain protein [Aspergillus clavatus NRRL 1]|uniref:C6 finger domain protein, putative n=1 Tax=Aspergillus clavatus (strain ATCC 1007 / CBS 513.65 / DSM 816 / NCTC 3887 / NRRL 1 / QM 1276 / 107) TaxID=344612 RepID=A1CMX9_ASPCL|nr:C6 finger domain protein, putative [Aspergillus clavatus NRRL 1]EAW08916.1 C6 finger domain protein, putative [Aspergillus clavatus NRRL 1]